MEKSSADVQAASSSVRYVEVAPQTGWQTMAKAVRDIDEDKVRDCKEDIDTLLVFAGLYSAVLSAFNIESYTALQPDPTDRIIELLERIAIQTQSYSITSHTANSSILPRPPLPSFIAPRWAVRVNGLWFASLIISLATASLSMLVKQWLREYLAFEYTAPRERLRARQYRKPELERWKVFEIAALLPILLHLSLGLFFIGLCFFTSNIDERMGFTSIPLVSGWAFFVITTTISPLVSPRCPYKIPLLRSILRLARTTLLPPLTRPLIITARGTPRLDLDLEDEEDNVITGDQDDKDILLSMDRIMADDNFLPMMWDMLKQRSDPPQMLAFFVDLVIDRIGAEGECLRPVRLRTIPDLSSLSRRAWDLFTEMLADLISHHHSGPLLVASPDWLHKTTLILLSSSPYPLPRSAMQCLRGLFVDAVQDKWCRAATSLAAWVAPRPGEQSFSIRPLYPRLSTLYTSTHGKKPPNIHVISFLYVQALRPYSLHHHDHNLQVEALLPFLLQEPEIFASQDARAILDDMWRLLHVVVSHTTFSNGCLEAIGVLTLFSEPMGKTTEMLATFQTLLRGSRWHYASLAYLTRVHRRKCDSQNMKPQLLRFGVDAFLGSTDQVQLILNSTCMAKNIAKGARDCYTPIDATRLCQLYLRLYLESSSQPPPYSSSIQLSNHRPDAKTPRAFAAGHWTALWPAVGAALRRYWEKEQWKRGSTIYFLPSYLSFLTPDEVLADDRQIAAECLAVMASSNTSANPGDAQSQSAFPDELFTALGLFILPEDVQRYPRLAKLQEQERLQSSRPAPGQPLEAGATDGVSSVA
ncbi:hypothetical protein PsYK624_066710 [Phanerochaete sordida]|uniref:DUF6535 domain-containing protein n=1 Tax=Phanerochaete sordida TaxID=48140 RepID=A0A9P3G923_9APHY|nr:hypothetical protein PsYK624_066710 [Phanerochaete sordida]